MTFWLSDLIWLHPWNVPNKVSFIFDHFLFFPKGDFYQNIWLCLNPKRATNTMLSFRKKTWPNSKKTSRRMEGQTQIHTTTIRILIYQKYSYCNGQEVWSLNSWLMKASNMTFQFQIITNNTENGITELITIIKLNKKIILSNP